nr:unnamed protein product [Callosobruchus chinensis]
MASINQKRSAIWMRFIPESNEKAKCNILHIVYSHKIGTTSNLRKHPTTEIETRRSSTNTELLHTSTCDIHKMQGKKKNMLQSIKNKLAILLKSANYLSLTTDGWTSCANESFAKFMRAAATGCLRLGLSGTIQTVVIDSAPNIVNAVKLNKVETYSMFCTYIEFNCPAYHRLKWSGLCAEEISSEKDVTVSKVIPIHYGLISVLKKFQTKITVSAVQELILDLLDSISKHSGRIELNPLLAKPTLLDPRFKAKAFSSADAVRCAEDAIQGDIVGLIQQHNNSVVSSPTNTVNAPQETCLENTKNSLIWQSFDALVENVSEASPMATAIMEIRLYLEERLIGRTENPLMWWKKEKHFIPTFQT